MKIGVRTVEETNADLVAVGALVELLLGVGPLVHLQVVGDGEALPTVGARERLLPHVEQNVVRPHVGRLCEPLPARDTHERTLPCVGDLVRGWGVSWSKSIMYVRAGQLAARGPQCGLQVDIRILI